MGGILLMYNFFTKMTRKVVVRGEAVCKFKLPTKNGFGVKKMLWPGPEAVEVRPPENSGILKSGIVCVRQKFWH